MDDLVIGGLHLVKVNMVKSLLSGKFEMKDMQELHYFLGIEVIRTPVVKTKREGKVIEESYKEITRRGMK